MKQTFARLRVGLTLLVTISLGLSSTANADCRLPGFFGDHMVLQQEMKIRIWGWAEAGESIDVSLGENSAKATANDAGKWQVELPPMKAAKKPLTLRVKGKNTIEVKDVLIGEVWLCSGQSNMEWPVRASTNSADEIAAAKYPLIRHIKIPRKPSTVPMDDVAAGWQICSPDTAGNFTAAGYFMARYLHKELDVPIGLVNSSWGGTRVEPWTPPTGFQQVAALQDIYKSVLGRTPGTPEYKKSLAGHIAATEKWLAQAKSAVNSTDSLAPAPAYPAELTPFKSHQDPTMLYNAMIHPLVGFPIRGAIWYQGESNHTEGMLYFEKKKALINGWRKLWKQGDFPFYYVQIAPFQYGNEDPKILARFWEAQEAVQQRVPKTGMVVINDIATLKDIHPPNKQDVGKRLALLALKNDYGRKDLVANSPEFDKLEVAGGQLKVSFKNTGGGLKASDGKAPTHFEIIGPGSKGFQVATAKIDGDTIILSSKDVVAPVAFRFAWHKLAEPNLTGGTGLPVGAVRGGTVPDFVSSLPVGGEYKLVYEVDLAELGSEISYKIDNSESLSSFDRIGYLVELNSKDHGDQKLFVSMEAFTNDVKKIGVPTAASKAVFQRPVKAMDVYSNVDGIETGTGIKSGNLEFWPNNYAPANSGKVEGASNTVFDCGDTLGPPVTGYGSMQIHNFGKKQTLFAINHWIQGVGADIGIGNSSGRTQDWTFAANAGSYSTKRLRVYVRPN